MVPTQPRTTQSSLTLTPTRRCPLLVLPTTSLVYPSCLRLSVSSQRLPVVSPTLSSFVSLDISPPCDRHSRLYTVYNSAEESLQDASHLFITQHELAKSCQVVINLEACGNSGASMAFQATSEEVRYFISAHQSRLTLGLADGSRSLQNPASLRLCSFG